MIRHPPNSPLFPSTPLSHSEPVIVAVAHDQPADHPRRDAPRGVPHVVEPARRGLVLHVERPRRARSEEHTSELQSPCNLVCRLLPEKKKKTSLHRTEPTHTY